MKRVISLLLTLVLLCTLVPAALGADEEATAAADVLNALGLFNGTGTGEDGRPIYDLDRAPTRSEAVTMLVRMLGKEGEAKAGTWDTPFTDLNWAAPYVGYAYAMGYTNGVSETEFGSASLITAAQYLTFVLRALGYESGKDFRWDAAWELTDELGVTHGEYSGENNAGFLRGDVVQVSAAALSAKMKDAPFTLAEKLMGEGVFTAEQYAAATGTAAGPGEFDPNGPENLALYTFEYDPDQDGYVITDYRKTPYDPNTGSWMDSEYCSFPSEYQGKPVIELRAYVNTKAERVSIPATLTTIASGALQSIENCREIIVDPDNPDFCSEDGVLLSKDRTVLLRYPEAKEGDSYTVPATVTAIGEQAFRGRYTGKKIDFYIPPTVNYVGEMAFNILSVENGSFPDVTIHIQGSTANWHCLCFAKCAARIETDVPLSSFLPMNAEQTEKGLGSVSVTAMEWAANGDLAVIRFQYQKADPAEEYTVYFRILNADGSVLFDYDWMILSKAQGEFAFRLPADYLNCRCSLTVVLMYISGVPQSGYGRSSVYLLEP